MLNSPGSLVVAPSYLSLALLVSRLSSEHRCLLNTGLNLAGSMVVAMLSRSLVQKGGASCLVKQGRWFNQV